MWVRIPLLSQIRTVYYVRSIYYKIDIMETKVCSRCEEEKLLDEFLFRNKENGTYHSACRECYKEIRKGSYERTKQTTADRNKRNRNKRRDWFNKLKSDMVCSRCSENHPACLDFHHTDQSEKEMNVSNMISEGYSEERIMEEINKCIILCANCHRKEHYSSIV